MNPKELDLQTPAFLATMSICGIDGEKAAILLRPYLSRVFHDPEITRVRMFRDVVGICRQSSAAAAGLHELAGLDFPRDRAFDALPCDIRAAVFLIVVLDFQLTETAFILRRDARELAGQIDGALDRLGW